MKSNGQKVHGHSMLPVSGHQYSAAQVFVRTMNADHRQSLDSWVKIHIMNWYTAFIDIYCTLHTTVRGIIKLPSTGVRTPIGQTVCTHTYARV